MLNVFQNISVAEATDLILDNIIDYGTEKVPLLDSIGRVLAQNVIADRDFPPFNRVCMDGICFKHEDFINGQRKFKILGVQAAGAMPKLSINVNECIEIMTGAMLPHSADCVIRYEDITIKDGYANINVEELPKGRNIHKMGMDVLEGKTVITKNRLIKASDINLLATIGISEPVVKSLPKVTIVSTGNELVDIDSNPKPWEIRRSNVYGVHGLLNSLGIRANTLHIPDEIGVMTSDLKNILEDSDIVILSGGVSKGKFDHVPDILNSLGVEKLFHGVNQRPGKPFWFGVKEDKKIFALPGNPMSTIACTLNYILPLIRLSLGLQANVYQNAKLKNEIFFKPKLTRFMESVLEIDSTGQCWIEPLKSNGSGDFTELVKCNVMMVLPANEDLFEKGQLVKFFYI